MRRRGGPFYVYCETEGGTSGIYDFATLRDAVDSAVHLADRLMRVTEVRKRVGNGYAIAAQVYPSS